MDRSRRQGFLQILNITWGTVDEDADETCWARFDMETPFYTHASTLRDCVVLRDSRCCYEWKWLIPIKELSISETDVQLFLKKDCSEAQRYVFPLLNGGAYTLWDGEVDIHDWQPSSLFLYFRWNVLHNASISSLFTLFTLKTPAVSVISGSPRC